MAFPSAGQCGESKIRRVFDQLEQRPRRSARCALPLLPIAHGFDRHSEPRGKTRLRQTRGGEYATGISGLVVVHQRNNGRESVLTDALSEFHESPVRLQPHAHGKNPLL